MSESSPAQTWQFTITRDDYYEAMLAVPQDLKKNQKTYLTENTWQQWVNVIILSFIFLTAFMGSSYLGKQYAEEVPWIFWGFFIFFAACLLTITKLSQINFKYYPRDAGPCLGHFKITLNKTHLKIAGSVQTSLTALHAILKIETTPNLILVFMDPHLAIPIPKRDIGDEAACRKLIEALTTSR